MNSFYYKYLACGPAFLYLKKRNFFEKKSTWCNRNTSQECTFLYQIRDHTYYYTAFAYYCSTTTAVVAAIAAVEARVTVCCV